MAPKRRDLGALSTRLRELSEKTNAVGPFEITDTIKIRQTRQRRDTLRAEHVNITTAQEQISELQRRGRELTEPEAPADDAGDDATAEYVRALGVWQAQIDHLNDRALAIVESMKLAAKRYEVAFFGDAYDDVMELSADWDAEFFDAVKQEIQDHFDGAVYPPPDGRDEDGAIVDMAEAVEAGK